MPDVVRTVGRYGIMRQVGRGGMGVVYLARQLDLDRLVALKEMAVFHAEEPALARRFVRESRLAGSLIHANVVTVFDFFEHDGTPYIAMEYVERGSLRPYVGRLDLAQIGGVLDGLLAGLGAAEQRGIVHRDLKPENLMVTIEGSVKIADFGIAKATQSTRTSAFVTATGTTIGTPQYMAPEQALARDIGPWSDLYSVGCIAYELFAGAPPFHDADTPMAIMLRHINEPLPSVREVAGVDQDISDWVARLTAKDRHDRPQSSADASEALEEILIAKLGPRWRRESRLGEPPSRPAAEAPPSISSGYVSFAWSETPTTGPPTPPHTEPVPEFEGIDLEGTGPDTPDGLPTAPTAHTPPTAPLRETTAPTARESAPTATPATDPLPETIGPAREPVPAAPAGGAAPGARAAPAEGAPARARLARVGAAGLLFAVLLPGLASGMDRWNLFAVLSPFDVLGAAIGAWLVARRPGPFAAGVLLGLGALSSVAALGLVKFAVERLDGAAMLPVTFAVLGAFAVLAAGISRLRAAGDEAPLSVDPGTLVLGLAGTALACVALFVNYDGFSSLWSEVGEGESAEFFFEPCLAVVAMLTGVVLVGGRPRFAAGLLLAAGAATALHFAGVLVAAWRAIGEVGEVRPAGFIGVAAGLLVLAAGFVLLRRSS